MITANNMNVVEQVKSNPNLELYEYDPDDYHGWLSLRNMLSRENGFKIRYGGSDVGKIMGYSSYMSPGMFFYECIGKKPDISDPNFYTYFGHVSEDLVRERYYPFWNMDTESEQEFFDNAYKNKVLQTAYPFPYTVINKRFPFLVVNVDGITDRLGEPGVYEGKSMNSWVARKFKDSIDPSYLAQEETYCIGMELSYWDMSKLEDKKYELLTSQHMDVEKRDTFQEKIVTSVKEFQLRVLECKKAMESGMGYDEYERLVAAMEPDSTEHERYFDEMKDRYNPDIETTLVAQEEDIELAMKYLDQQTGLKVFEKDMEITKNQMLKRLKDRNATILEYGDSIAISYKADKRGIRKFHINSKLNEL
ncbi:MAG: YqaJ viral recombinase family protein [Cyanothece sp. SIO1E1]|nr:YqaJ viral recombinase family protein [Cyanothece sp. SIO1E1]